MKVCLPNEVYEGDLNPNRTSRGKLLFKRGEQTVSGQRALDYVRIRHGIGDGSDIGRIKRQQAFTASLIKEIKSDGLTPTRLLPLADAAAKSLTVDPGLGSVNKLVSFAMNLRDIDLHNTKFVTLPWRYQGSRVAVVEPDASVLWGALKDDLTIDGQDPGSRTKARQSREAPASPSAAADVSGAGIDVAVYNGTATSGLASSSVDAHRTRLQVTGTGNASGRDADTVIEYGAAFATNARTLARLFPGARLDEAPLGGVRVVLGQSYATSMPATSAMPTSVAANTRSADDDPCSDLSYG